MSYIATNFDFFNGDQRSDIVNDLPKRLVSLKDKYPELSEVKLLNLLHKKSANTDKIPIDRIEFMNTGSMDSLQKDEVIQSWEYLLEHSNEDFRKLGEDLIRYSYLTAGFNFTPFSFSHLIPNTFYDKLVNDTGDSQNIDSFNNFLEKKVSASKESNVAFVHFIDQFYRNNYSNSSFVPSVNKENTNISSTNKDFEKDPKTIYVEPKNVKSKDFIVKGGMEPIYSPYIKKTIKGKIHLFKLSNMSSDALLQYTIVEKLGVPNRVFEYDFDNSGLNSIFAFNNLKSNKKEEVVLAESVYEYQDVVDDSLTSGVLDVESDIEIESIEDDVDTTAGLFDPQALLDARSKVTEDSINDKKRKCNG
jgi:hypothetical protein